MTSAHDIERDLEDLSEDVLGDLDPDERAALAIELAAAGDFEKAERVKHAAPVKTYHARDLDFSDRLTDNVVMALYAMWELEKRASQFFYERARGQLDEVHYEQYPDAEWTEAPTEENGFHEQRAMDAAAAFLGSYLAWERYAAEDVGVALETFLSHPFGGTVTSDVSVYTLTASIADGSHFDDELEIDGWADGGTVTVEGEELTAEELAEAKYQSITSDEGPIL